MKVLGPLLCLLWAVFAAAEENPFRWTLERHKNTARVTVHVADGYYLYAKTVRLNAESRKKTVNWIAPVPVMQADEAVYPAGAWVWTAAVPAKEKFTLSVTCQGCSAAGECLLPETVYLTGQTALAVPAPDAGLPPFRVIRRIEGLTGVPEFLAFLQGGAAPAAVPVSWVWMCLLALLGGIMLNFTPCVLPLIPVNLSIIGAGSGSGWKRGLARASCYGAGMALAYGILGAAAVLTGARFGAVNSSALFNAVIALVFLGLALAMFGVFSLDLSGWSRRVPLPKPERRTMLTALSLGAMAALLAGACVAPVLIAVIVYAAEVCGRGNPAGLLLPLVLGIGMALPWPAAGAGLAVLPKPGMWMVKVKLVFGGLILLAAGYYGYTAWTLRPGAFQAEKEMTRLDAALRTGRPVVVDFWASWCGNCKKMEQTTLRDPQVLAALKNVEFVRFQAEKLSDPAVKALLDRCGVRGLPAFVLMKGE